MGEVHLALDTRLGRKVAVKLLLDEFTTDAERLRRFEQEARAASALNHPNIITVHEIGEIEGRRFIVTEYDEFRPAFQRRRCHSLHIASRRRRLNSTVATRRNGPADTYPALKRRAKLTAPLCGGSRSGNLCKAWRLKLNKSNHATLVRYRRVSQCCVFRFRAAPARNRTCDH